MLAERINAFPINTGFKNVILSMLAVTIFALPACLFADKPAIRSTCFSITPPKTLPFGLASEGNIIIVISAFDSCGHLQFLDGFWDNVIELYYHTITVP